MHPARENGRAILAPSPRDIQRWARVASDLRELMPYLSDERQNAADVAQGALTELAATYQRSLAVDRKTLSVGS